MDKETKKPTISDFFVGRSIFITGATGFIGKVLIEKLLRSCPDVAEIFLLIRPKKGLGIDVRLKELLDNKLFDKLRNERPSSFNKLIPIMGDAAALDLGLLPADRQILIEKVSVIFHVAASVRFDDSLKDAIFINVRSTRDVCTLASSMKNLAVLLHVSSTYAQIDKRIVEEILYPMDVDWRQTIEIAESVDEYIMKILTAKYIGNMPNTYIFAKKLAEQVISDYSKSLPCVLVRPSIVVSTMDEPLKGWIDNFNGPIGMLVGGGKGILRVCFADPDVNSDYVPVDVIVKTMITSARQRGLKTIADDNMVHVYNCSTNEIQKLSIMGLQQLGFNILREFPLERIIWSPHTIITKNYLLYYVLMLLLHILPAMLIDCIIKLFGARPILLKLQRKVYVSNCALSHFLLNEWSFKNDSTIRLVNNLATPEDKKNFEFQHVNINLREYFRHGLIGTKVYLLKESMKNLKAAKLHRKRMDWLHNILKMMFITFILWIVYRQYMLPHAANVFLQ